MSELTKEWNTESVSDAVQKACPMTKSDEGEMGTCIGDDCMMWRWHESGLFDIGPVGIEPEEVDPQKGYCGLAGRP